ncbi:hypothetical protein F5Y19DRAFT_432612 [Xylariaceae sp. FL1651]|nr:hypothetical protein F5Y19DRAFT_432612 [Xylariaceae sp. FL1651]
MASLNLSINGPSIKSSYQGVINAPAPPSGSSSTYGHWALFSVQAPLANAFQDNGSKESVLKVQATGDGELEDLIEDFNEGRIQFAFVKIKDPNTGLPKYALIAWCGEGVPERTKGYFTSHLNAVSKILHGYHVQITARSSTDLEPTNILKKVADASGANYTAGGSAPMKSRGPPPAVKSKPVFAGSSGSTISFNPIIAARNASLRQKTNDDGWGDDAPPVSRSEIQKVQSAYQPTKVNMDELRSQKQAPSRFNGSTQADDRSSDVIGGSYKPVGKVDIAAIRAAAKEKKDDRPTVVKGAYEPVGKVDIAAIRAKSQKPSEPEAEDPDEQPKTLAERSAAFNRSERLTEMPKPKVAKKFTGASAFMGTKAPTPGALGFGGPSPVAAAPVGTASRTFADQGGKTPAQIWAEKKAQQGGASTKVSSPPATSPVVPQQSGGGWQSGYSGKSWKPVDTGAYGRGIPGQKTGETATSQETSEPPSRSVSSIKDQFNEAPPPVPSAARPRDIGEEHNEPPPLPVASRPSDSGPSGGFALPGMPPRPPPTTDEEEEEAERSPSPVRIAMPVSRGPEPEIEPVQEPQQSLPVRSIEREVLKDNDIPNEEEAHDPRAAATAVAEEQFGHEPVAQAQLGTSGGKRALIQYDYEKAEDNELELREGEYVTNIEMVDDDWWMGTNSQGETGLFPSNYVELVDDEPVEDVRGAAAPEPHPAAIPPPSVLVNEPERQPGSELKSEPAVDVGHTATAQFDYEAAEDNELSFPEGATITHLEFPDEDWWYGQYKGEMGLFPANYVQLDQ